MTKPLRRALLNAEISLEARRIAHAATRSCKWDNMPNDNNCHTPKCNLLKLQIENLVLTVKFAEKQPSERPVPPAFELQPEDQDAPRDR